LPPETTPALFGNAQRLSDPASLAKIRSDLPMLIMSGSDDPLAGGGELTRLIGKRYADAGVADVTVKVYPGARHEIFNEVNRDEVTADVIAWLREH
jgi:alpha-beta hydrolase superfamily lysophospholipase